MSTIYKSQENLPIHGIHRIRFAQIETSTHCNYRCPYCQVSFNSRPLHSMTTDECQHIIYELSKLPALQTVYLNGYNEPSIDPNIVDHIRLAANLNSDLVLLTNGTGLTAKKCADMARNHPRLTLDIHLSAISPMEYRTVHGVTLSPNFLPRLRTLVECTDLASIIFRVMVMGIGDQTHKSNWEAVKTFFSGTRMVIGMDVVHDRARTLPPPFLENQRYGRVIGCALDNRPLDWIHITASGNWVICCQDYEEDYIYGNLFQQSIEDVAKSKTRLQVIERAMNNIPKQLSGMCTRCHYAVLDEHAV